MSETTGKEVHTPGYLDDVERLIGLRFRIGEDGVPLTLADAGELSGDTRNAYAGVYAGGLRLLLEARRRFGLTPEDPLPAERAQWNEFREIHAEAIGELRARVADLAPVLSSAPEGLVTATTLRAECRLGRMAMAKIMSQLDPVLVTFKRAGRSIAPHSDNYLARSDADQVRAIARAIEVPDAKADDVSARSLIGRFRTSSGGLASALEATGIVLQEKQSGPTRKRTLVASPAEVAKLENYFATIDDLTGLQAVNEIAELANVSADAVGKQIAWHGFDAHSVYKRQRIRDGDSAYLPEDLAKIILHELQIIVPDGYLTLGEYAYLRDVDYAAVHYVVKKHKLPVHTYAVRDHAISYLDGATMFALNKLVKPYPLAPADWKTMPQIEALVDASSNGISRYLPDFPDSVQKMKPHDGVGRAVEHYSPDFVAFIEGKIKPKQTVQPQGRTSHLDLIEQTGMTSSGLTAALRRAGVTVIEGRTPAGAPAKYYADEEIATALASPNFPRRHVPYESISMPNLAAANKTTSLNMRQFLRRRGIQPTGRYLTEAGGVGVYYQKAEMSALGLKVPSSPAAFPAGELIPFGRDGISRQQNSPTRRKPPEFTPLPVAKEKPPVLTHELIAEILWATLADVNHVLIRDPVDALPFVPHKDVSTPKLSTRVAAVIARDILTDRLRILPQTQLNLTQISLLVGGDTRAVEEYINANQIHPTSGATYGSEQLDEILAHFGVNLRDKKGKDEPQKP